MAALCGFKMDDDHFYHGVTLSASRLAGAVLTDDVVGISAIQGCAEFVGRTVAATIGYALLAPIALIETAVRAPFAALGLLGYALSCCCESEFLKDLSLRLMIAPAENLMVAGVSVACALITIAQLFMGTAQHCCCAPAQPQAQPPNPADHA